MHSSTYFALSYIYIYILLLLASICSRIIVCVLFILYILILGVIVPVGAPGSGNKWSLRIIGRTLVTNDAQSACLLKIQTKSQLARELLTIVLDATVPPTTTISMDTIRSTSWYSYSLASI